MRAPWPFGQLGLKLLSVGLAVMLWMIVSGEETVERGLRIPLEFQQFPAGLELQEEMPSTVDVRVRGGSGTLSRLSPADVIAVLDLHGARPGRQLFHLTPEQVRAPFGVEVTQVAPPSIALVFENTGSRVVPIAPVLDGKPAPGYIVGKITTDPITVEVVGPESVVNRVSEAITEPVSVAGATSAVRDTVTVGFVEPSVRMKVPRAATVSVDIALAPLERTVRGRPVYLRNMAPNLSARAVPAIVDVTMRGNRDPLNRITADEISTYVDLAGLGAGEYTLTVDAETPGDVGVTSIVPPRVQVVIHSVQD
jgi:YbbR domain-containing protein